MVTIEHPDPDSKTDTPAPFARVTEADRRRWRQAVRDGLVPRICLVPLDHASRRGDA